MEPITQLQVTARNNIYNVSGAGVAALRTQLDKAGVPYTNGRSIQIAETVFQREGLADPALATDIQALLEQRVTQQVQTLAFISAVMRYGTPYGF